MYSIRTKRIYEAPEVNDGIRILVDRLWPRGIKKESAAINAWEKEIAPSNELRKWFNHDSEKYPEFRRKYMEELDASEDAERFLEYVSDIQKKDILSRVITIMSKETGIPRDEHYSQYNVSKEQAEAILSETIEASYNGSDRVIHAGDYGTSWPIDSVTSISKISDDIYVMADKIKSRSSKHRRSTLFC